MKKPFAVTIVEVLGWFYLALLVSLAAAHAACANSSKFALCMLLLEIWPVPILGGFVFSLRQGCRALFLCPHTAVLLLVAAGLVAYSRVYLDLMVVVAIALSLALAVVPIILLYLPRSNKWFAESGSIGVSARSTCAIAIVCLVFAVVVSLPEMGCCRNMAYNRKSQDVGMFGRNLREYMVANMRNRDGAAAWIDPSHCTNSTQFVEALTEGSPDFDQKYMDVWCIAVNPPVNDNFPILFTHNINLHGLLPEQDDKWRLEFACPEVWGGTCLGFCKKMGVIILSDGTLLIPRGKMRRLSWIFPNGRPIPVADTYFLTPTGRVDLTKR